MNKKIQNRSTYKFAFLLVWIFTISNISAQWVSRSSMQGSANRNGAISWVIGNRIFIVAGGGSGDLQEYNATSNTWTIKSPVPWSSQRGYPAGFVINGKGYLC